jgi:peptidoglycan/LPS O-acetylase OafA/YrhL
VLNVYAGFGATGVTFFFVLSGFVLTWSFAPGDTAPRFYWRRFARIWPLHFVTTLLALPVFYTWQDQPLDWGPIALSVFLLHAWVPSTTVYFAGNPASWSLSCEMFFYALHPLMVRRVLALGLVGLAALALATCLALGFVADWAIDWPERVTGWLLYVAPIYRVGEFLLGMALAVAIKRGLRIPIGVLPAASLVAAWFVLYYNVSPHFLSWSQRVLVANLTYPVLPLLYALVIAAAAQLDLAGKPSVLRAKPMVLLGQWSYALYLIHATIIYTFIHFLGARSNAGFANVLWLGLVTAVCVGASAVLYQFVEHPLESRLRGLQRRRIAERQPVKAGG